MQLNFQQLGYIVIEKVNSTSGVYENETIQYTGKSGNDLTGCTRGTSSPYKGNTPGSYNSRNTSLVEQKYMDLIKQQL
jgi:hypothetical protein